MNYQALVQSNGLSVTIEGLEVLAVFGAEVAGGLLEDFSAPLDGSSIRDAAVRRFQAYCVENLIPVPTPEQITLLGA